MSRSETPPLSRRERRAQARLERPARPARAHRRQPARPAWQSPMALVTAAAVVIGAVLVFLALPRNGSGDELLTPTTSYPTALIDGEAVGAADAPVTIELWSDFQCPACQLFVTERLPRLLNDYVKSGIARLEARDIAFLGTGNPDESLELAAGAACAAAQDRYWTFHDLAFWNQGRENRGDHDARFIERIADASGLDRTAFDACFASNDVRGPINTTTASAISAGITSTPTLVVNGERLVGVPDYEDLAALMDRKAAEAAAASASPAP